MAPRRLRLLTATACMAVAVATVGATTMGLVIEEPTRISDSQTLISDHSRVAVTDDGTIHVVWEEADPRGFNVIQHRYRRPGDGEFRAPATIFYHGREPAIAARGDDVGVVMVKDASGDGGQTEIYFRTWNRDTFWGDFERVSIGSGGKQPDIAFDRGVMWLTWVDTSSGDERPYYARLEGGTAAGEPVADAAKNATSPRLAVSAEGTVYVTWRSESDLSDDSVITYAFRDRDSQSWSDPQKSLWLEARRAFWPDIAASGERMCLTWHEEVSASDHEVLVYCEGPQVYEANVSNSGGVRSLKPSIDLSSGLDPLVLWQERTTPDKQILFRRILGAPSDPGDTVRAGEVDSPDLTYHGDHVHAVWTERTDTGSDVHYGRWLLVPPTATPTATTVASATPTATRTPIATATPPRNTTIYLPQALQPSGR